MKVNELLKLQEELKHVFVLQLHFSPHNIKPVLVCLMVMETEAIPIAAQTFTTWEAAIENVRELGGKLFIGNDLSAEHR